MEKDKILSEAEIKAIKDKRNKTVINNQVVKK